MKRLMMSKHIQFVTAVIALLSLNGCAGYPSGKEYTATELIPRDAKVGIMLKKDNGQQNAIANSLAAYFTETHGKYVSLIEDPVTQAHLVDYIIHTEGLYNCARASSNATGILITGLTAALAPVTIASSPLSLVTSYFSVIKTKDGLQVGKGVYSRSGSGIMVNCDKMMRVTAEFLDEKQFVPKL